MHRCASAVGLVFSRCLGDRLMVGQEPLKLLILVRFQVPQPVMNESVIKFISKFEREFGDYLGPPEKVEKKKD